MRLPLFLLLATASVCFPLAAQPVISEFMASNSSTISDEDGDFSDWIEIHNPDAEAVDLTGWHLTDDVEQPDHWTFPSIVLPARGYLLVWASGKDRRVPGAPLHTDFSLSAGGEYLGLVRPDGTTLASEFAPGFPQQNADVSYGVSTPSQWIDLVGKSDAVRVLVPDETTGPALGDTWRERLFDDAAWLAGTLDVGFKVGNDVLGMLGYIETDVRTQMYQQADRKSVYLRVPFEIGNPADVLALDITTSYDDGYATFLNGGATPVDAANAPAVLTWLSGSTATEYDGNGLSTRSSDLTNHRGRLVAGTNVLSIQGLNTNQGSSDLLVAPRLRARVVMPGVGMEGYFATSTPGAANPGEDGLSIGEMVSFSVPSRPFTGSLAVALGGAGAGQVIRYTTNGSEPTAASNLYTAPLTVTSTTLLRARVFGAAGIGGPVTTAHYPRLAADVAGRRSNLPMLVLDARGQSLNSTSRTPAMFHLFDRDADGISALDREPTLATRQGLRWRGSSSESFPKKPYSVEFWDENGSELRHPVLGMAEESDWVLYAPYWFDRAYIRNPVAFELSRRAGRWAPHSRMVEVFFNGDGGDLTASDYVGVYAITEQINLNPRRLGYRTVEPTDVPPAGPIDVGASGPWTGGYLFKFDRADADEYQWETNLGYPSGLGVMALSRPKLADLDGGPFASVAAAAADSRQIAYLTSYVQTFESTLAAERAGGFSTRSYMNFIDRDAWVDHLLVNAFAKNVDALRLSGYYHKPEDSPIIAGPVWDFDRSMDSYDGRDDGFTTWNGTEDSTPYFTYDWWGTLAADPDFLQAFYDRWAELRQSEFSNAGLADVIQTFGDEVRDSANGLGSAADRDAARWPDNTPRSGGYPAEVTALLSWMQNRAAWMDRRRVDGGLLPPPPFATLSQNPFPAGGTVTLGDSGGSVYYRLDGGDPRGAGGAIVGDVYAGPLVITGPVDLVARVRTRTGDWSTPLRLHLLAPDPGPRFLPGGSADWNVDANWENNPAPYPDAGGAAAVVGPSEIEGDRNVELTAPVTIGRIGFPQGDSPFRNRLRDAAGGATLTFDNSGVPARIDVDGSGTGFVEFEIESGTVLASDLEVDVANIAGDPEYGALRLREPWTGPGGFAKLGPGIASLTGGSKHWQGATEIREGVLRVTEPAVMEQSSAIEVFDGGQLRLVSASAPATPRVYTFGGPVVLRGTGRGPAFESIDGSGRLGALRQDPGGGTNLAVVTNPVQIPVEAGIHVEGSDNHLELAGALSGQGHLIKTGGGTLDLAVDISAFGGPVTVDNGVLRSRGVLASTVRVETGATWNAAGASGDLSGSGTIDLPATTLAATSVNGLHRIFRFSLPGAPDPTMPGESGNALLITDDAGIPASTSIYIDAVPAPEDRFRGAYLLPPGQAWETLLQTDLHVYHIDPGGLHFFDGETWTESASTIVTSVPTTLDTAQGPVAGRILEVRFDGIPVDFAAWRDAVFSPEDLADPAISGALADPHHSGLSNLFRFAFGLSPSDRPSGSMPALVSDESGLVFRFPYDPSLRALRWIAEASGDPADWSSASVLFDSHVDLSPPGPDGWIELVDPTPVSSRRFYRLRLEWENE